MENQIIKLWAFYHNEMVHESVSSIISYHRTKKGAESAMKIHKSEAKQKWIDRDARMKKRAEEKGEKHFGCSKFGSFEAWYVQKFNLTIKD